MNTFFLRIERGLPLAAALVLLAGATGCPSDDTEDSTETGGDPSTSTTGSGGETSTGEPPAESTGEASTGPGPGSSTGDETGEPTGDSSGEPGTSTGAMGLEIAGTWIEDIGGGDPIVHAIDELTWDTTSPFGDSLYHIETYDNDARWVIAQGDASNEFFPELYNKFNWYWEGDALYYCTAVFDAETAADAMAAPDADPGDLMMGCGGFPWSSLEPEA